MEEQEQDVCQCEDKTCGYSPLKHHEKCPKCNSEAYHRVIRGASWSDYQQ